MMRKMLALGMVVALSACASDKPTAHIMPVVPVYVSGDQYEKWDCEQLRAKRAALWGKELQARQALWQRLQADGGLDKGQPLRWLKYGDGKEVSDVAVLIGEREALVRAMFAKQGCDPYR